MSLPRLTRQPQQPQPTTRHSNIFEPDEEWKKGVRDRIRAEAQRLHLQSVQNLRDDWLKRSGDVSDPTTDPMFMTRCDEIERDIQRWANDEYRNELDRETNVNKLMAGQEVPEEWAHLVEEQHAILSQIQADKARRESAARVEEELEPEPPSPDLGPSQVNFPDKPSGSNRLSATERELGTPQRRSSPLNQDDMFASSSQPNSLRRTSYPSRRPIPELWAPPPDDDSKPTARRGSNASVRSVGSNTPTYRAPTAPATIPERGPVPPEVFERTASVGALPSHHPFLSGSSPPVIQQDPPPRIERNRAGSVNSHRSHNSGSFPDRPPVIEHNSPLPSSPDASGGEGAYFSRPVTNPRPSPARPGPPLDVEYDRPASGAFRAVPERSPVPPFQQPPPPYQPANTPYQPANTSPYRERYSASTEWRDRKLSNPENVQHVHYVRPDSYDIYPPQEHFRRPTVDTRFVPPTEYHFESEPSSATYYDDPEPFSPEEEFVPPVRTASRMKFNATGWVKQNGMRFLPPDVYRDWNSASSAYNMDDYRSLPPKERKLWLWIEDIAYKLELEQQELQKKQEKVEREKEETKRREEELRQQEDDLKRREYDLLFRQREVEMTAKFREKEDLLKWREEDLRRQLERRDLDEQKRKEEEERRADDSKRKEINFLFREMSLRDERQEELRREQIRRKKAEEEEERRRAEEEEDERRRLVKEKERRKRLEEERRRQLEEERQRQLEEEEEEERQRQLEERQRLEDEERRRRLEEQRRAEARRAAEEYTRHQEKLRRVAEEEEERRAEEARRQELKRQEERERLLQESRREEERRRAAEEESRRLAEEASRRAAAEEALRRVAEEERRKSEEARARREREERSLLLERERRAKIEAEEEQQRMKAEEERRAAEEERQNQARLKKADEVARENALRKEREADLLRQQQEEEARAEKERQRRQQEELPKDDDASRAEIERRRREEQRQREQEARLDAELNRLHEQARLRNLAEQGLAGQDNDPYPDLLNRGPSFTTPRKVNVPPTFGERPTPTPTRSWESWGKTPQHTMPQPSTSRPSPQKQSTAPSGFPKPATSAVPPPASTAPRAPLSSAEWARRQAEHAKKQQEQFILEQERMERARQEKLARSMTKEDVMQTFEWHERMWVRLAEADELTWDMFPWPMLKKPMVPEDITTVAIDAYVRSPLGPGREKSDKDRVKEHIRRWHPDRFETKLLPKVEASQKELVKTGAGLVARGLNELLTRANPAPGLFG